jgi:hypothetical protein
MFRDLPRILRCLTSLPMAVWAAITAAPGRSADNADRTSTQDPGQYFADDPWVD